MIHPEKLQEYIDIMKAIMKMPELSTVYRNVKQVIVRETLLEFIEEFEDRKITYIGFVDSCVSTKDYKSVFDKIVNEQKEKS
jgi:chaperonin cofactor prefoldin